MILGIKGKAVLQIASSSSPLCSVEIICESFAVFDLFCNVIRFLFSQLLWILFNFSLLLLLSLLIWICLGGTTKATYFQTVLLKVCKTLAMICHFDAHAPAHLNWSGNFLKGWLARWYTNRVSSVVWFPPRTTERTMCTPSSVPLQGASELGISRIEQVGSGRWTEQYNERCRWSGGRNKRQTLSSR